LEKKRKNMLLHHCLGKGKKDRHGKEGWAVLEREEQIGIAWEQGREEEKGIIERV